MLKTRAMTAVAAGLATTGLLAGVAFAWTTASGDMTTASSDADDARISTLAQTTTAVGEAKGDVVSAAARDADDHAAADNDRDEAAQAADNDRDEAAKTEDNDRDEAARTHTDQDAHGDAVSAVAHDKTAKGEAHGDAVSTAAHHR